MSNGMMESFSPNFFTETLIKERGKILFKLNFVSVSKPIFIYKFQIKNGSKQASKNGVLHMDSISTLLIFLRSAFSKLLMIPFLECVKPSSITRLVSVPIDRNRRRYRAPRRWSFSPDKSNSTSSIFGRLCTNDASSRYPTLRNAACGRAM